MDEVRTFASEEAGVVRAEGDIPDAIRKRKESGGEDQEQDEGVDVQEHQEDGEMSREKRRVAAVDIDRRLLVDLLGYKGGRILKVTSDVEVWNPNKVRFIIEHEEFGEISEGDNIPLVTTVYTGNEGLTRVGRFVR
jgi:hypothetical protein